WCARKTVPPVAVAAAILLGALQAKADELQCTTLSDIPNNNNPHSRVDLQDFIVRQCTFAPGQPTDDQWGFTQVIPPTPQNHFSAQVLFEPKSNCYTVSFHVFPSDPPQNEEICPDNQIGGIATLADSDVGTPYGDPMCTPLPVCGNQCMSDPAFGLFASS